MNVIWKFPLRPWSAFIDMPKGARILHAGTDATEACVWALCDPNRPKEPRYVVSVPTGDAVPQYATDYVGTFKMDEGTGPLIFHVFEGPAHDKDGVTQCGSPASGEREAS